MARKDLADWIKTTESRGYSEAQAKDFLLKKGFSKKDVDEAVDSLSPKKVEVKKPLEKKVEEKKQELSLKKNLYWDIFKPNFFNLFLPCLVLILIIISTYMNFSLAPSLGEFCSFESNQQLRFNYTNLTMMEPKHVIDILTENDLKRIEFQRRDFDVLSDIKKLILTNLYVYPSGIYALDPLFPVPCELFLEDITNFNEWSCRYYISSEQYECLHSKSHSYPKTPPEYNKISLLLLITHSIILVILIYILICLLIHFNKFLLNKNLLIRILFGLSLLILSIYLMFVTEQFFLFWIIFFEIFFVIMLFIKNPKRRIIFSIISILLLILLLICGIILVNWMSDRTIQYTVNPLSKTLNVGEYQVISCVNGKLKSYGQSEGLNFNSSNIDCNNTYNDVCRDGCSSYIHKQITNSSFFYVCQCPK